MPNDTSRVACDQLAPVRLRTAGTVLVMIQKSVDSDHVSMYSTSSFTQSAKLMSFRPCTCQMQVMPGRIDRRLRSKVR